MRKDILQIGDLLYHSYHVGNNRYTTFLFIINIDNKVKRINDYSSRKMTLMRSSEFYKCDIIIGLYPARLVNWAQDNWKRIGSINE